MTETTPRPPRVLAIGAHPDDVEFHMAGTFILLGRAGYELHYMSLANGCCGSTEHGPGEAAEIRRHEAMAAAAMIGAKFHPSLVNDMEIVYDVPTAARLAAVVRQVAPRILLTHPPNDYMEDHEATCRLAVTA
ncbi:MAG TPA: PIG-L family deacetylase, partial [Pirellulales bacterium]|nr:PIG-L family deacetylase [Pirellulales bacterium]